MEFLKVVDAVLGFLVQAFCSSTLADKALNLSPLVFVVLIMILASQPCPSPPRIATPQNQIPQREPEILAKLLLWKPMQDSIGVSLWGPSVLCPLDTYPQSYSGVWGLLSSMVLGKCWNQTGAAAASALAKDTCSPWQ